MTRSIKKAAVLGAGVMGSGIAAHLANAGIPTYLFDIVPKFTDTDSKAGLTETSPAFRSKIARTAIAALEKTKPSPIFSKRELKLLTPANFEDDMDKIGQCDLIIEAVVERLDIKEAVYAKIEKAMKPEAIVTSNTSTIPLELLTQGRNDTFTKNFVITHFFNPVRYMKLLELVSGPKTDPDVVKTIATFMEESLGKGVVFAKDSPAFIANRIGIASGQFTILTAMQENYTIEEVDKIMGQASARPKMGMFRLLDQVGIDVVRLATQSIYEKCPGDEKRDQLQVPQLIVDMVDRGWIGNKSGQGFYKKVKKPDGSSDVLAMDIQTGEYRPKQDVKLDSLKKVKNIADPGERLKTLVSFDDRGGHFAWKVTRDTLIYAANRVPEVADDVVNVDNALKWGFNWEIGPFEIWDALGVEETLARIKQDGLTVPALVEKLLKAGAKTFYKSDTNGRSYFDFRTNQYQPVPQNPKVVSLAFLKSHNKVIKKNPGASLIDLGDGVACLEFHTKMNAIDADIGGMMRTYLEEVEKNFAGLVITNEAENFSVGANLMLVLMTAQQQNWAELDRFVKEFQDVCLALRYSKKPVVSAPFGLTLGGGCEIAMAADSICAAAETYIGLVEVGVGLIPAGGGCKNLILNIEKRFRDKYAKAGGWAKADGGPMPRTQAVFETIAFAKIGTSAREGQELGYLKATDRVVLNRSHLTYEAKQHVLEMAKTYVPGEPRKDIGMPGAGGHMAIRAGIRGFREQNIISEHDAFIADKLAYVLTAGNHPAQCMVSEQEILDLEREVFISLCGEPKSQERMAYMLMNNKPLRN